jgi:hypothetical protein
MATPTHTVRVADALWDKAAERAQVNGITITDVVITALREYAELGSVNSHGVQAQPSRLDTMVSQMEELVTRVAELEDAARGREARARESLPDSKYMMALFSEWLREPATDVAADSRAELFGPAALALLRDKAAAAREAAGSAERA